MAPLRAYRNFPPALFVLISVHSQLHVVLRFLLFIFPAFPLCLRALVVKCIPRFLEPQHAAPHFLLKSPTFSVDTQGREVLRGAGRGFACNEVIAWPAPSLPTEMVMPPPPAAHSWPSEIGLLPGVAS